MECVEDGKVVLIGVVVQVSKWMDVMIWERNAIIVSIYKIQIGVITIINAIVIGVEVIKVIADMIDVKEVVN